MAQQASHLTTLVQHPLNDQLSSKPDTAEEHSRDLRPAGSLPPRRQGVQCGGAVGHRQWSPYTMGVLQRLADALMLARAYNEWYKKQSKIEQELLVLFQELADSSHSTRVQQHCRAYSFREVLWKAIELVQEEDEHDLLDVCKQAITQHKQFDAQEFIDFHTVIRGHWEGVRCASRAGVMKAVERQLQHNAFALQVASDW